MNGATGPHGSPLRNADGDTTGAPECTVVPSGPPKSQCLLLRSEWKWVDLWGVNIQIKTKIKEPGISSHRLFQGVKDKALKTSAGTTRREILHLPRLGTPPSHSSWTSFHILSSSLGNQQYGGKRTCWVTEQNGQNTPAFGRHGLQPKEANHRGGWRSQL